MVTLAWCNNKQSPNLISLWFYTSLFFLHLIPFPFLPFFFLENQTTKQGNITCANLHITLHTQGWRDRKRQSQDCVCSLSSCVYLIIIYWFFYSFILVQVISTLRLHWALCKNIPELLYCSKFTELVLLWSVFNVVIFRQQILTLLKIYGFHHDQFVYNCCCSLFITSSQQHSAVWVLSSFFSDLESQETGWVAHPMGSKLILLC